MRLSLQWEQIIQALGQFIRLLLPMLVSAIAYYGHPSYRDRSIRPITGSGLWRE